MNIVFVRVIVSCLALLTPISVTHASSSGSPVCTVDGPAPNDIHLLRDASITGTGSIASAGFNITINGVDVSNGLQLNSSIPYLVEVTATTELPLKGVLIIASKQGTDTSGIFSLTTVEQAMMLQISNQCMNEARSGVTHRNSDFKTKVSASMNFDQGYTDLKLDVNVVTQNNETGSYYYHSQFTFDVVAPLARTGCGLFGWSIFCPFTFCGFFGRLLFGLRDC